MFAPGPTKFRVSAKNLYETFSYYAASYFFLDLRCLVFSAIVRGKKCLCLYSSSNDFFKCFPLFEEVLVSDSFFCVFSGDSCFFTIDKDFDFFKDNEVNDFLSSSCVSLINRELQQFLLDCFSNSSDILLSCSFS